MHVPTQKLNRIVQIDVTSHCDLSCGNCTRALAQHRKPDMTPEQFERAVLACKDWILRERGVLAIFGGNPCVSKFFPDYARILADHIPEPHRGLWTNNINGHGETIRKYIGPRARYNINVHNQPAAAAEVRQELPWATIYGESGPSRHASIFVAAQDFIKNDIDLWVAVNRCDYDIKWSAIVMQEAPDWQTLGGYSCEIAGTHARTHGKALGVPVVPGWLDGAVDAFRHQYDFACRRCGGCLKLDGPNDLPGVDQYSKTNERIVTLTVSKRRRLELVDSLSHASEPTDYLRLRQ